MAQGPPTLPSLPPLPAWPKESSLEPAATRTLAKNPQAKAEGQKDSSDKPCSQQLQILCEGQTDLENGKG